MCEPNFVLGKLRFKDDKKNCEILRNSNPDYNIQNKNVRATRHVDVYNLFDNCNYYHL